MSAVLFSRLALRLAQGLRVALDRRQFGQQFGLVFGRQAGFAQGRSNARAQFFIAGRGFVEVIVCAIVQRRFVAIV